MSNERKEGKLCNYERHKGIAKRMWKIEEEGGGRSERKVGLNRR